MTKYLAWLAYGAACAVLIAQEGSAPTFRVYAGYLGVATVMGRECTVDSINPFKLDIDPFAGPAYSPPDITGVRVPQ